MYLIRIRNIEYEVSVHAAKRMLQRFISEEMVIETVEQGMLIDQPHGIDLYEHQLYDPEDQQMRIIRIAVNLNERTIVSVFDDEDTDYDFS
jgi:hypothetical protein